MMEMAKVTSKGQITIPISIRRRLGINEGDKILFVNKQEGVLMLNPDTVQGDLADYTADSIPIETTKTVKPGAKPVPAAAAEKQIPDTAAGSAAAAIKESPAAPAAEPAAAPAAKEATPEPPVRKYIPPVEEPDVKPAARPTGGIDLNTILDDIRSIGSNI